MKYCCTMFEVWVERGEIFHLTEMETYWQSYFTGKREVKLGKDVCTEPSLGHYLTELYYCPFCGKKLKTGK